MKEAELSAAKLYEEFRKGDKTAFEALVITYRQSLMLFINRFVNDIDTAEDLAEDVFVRLLIKKPRYTGEASFKTWLFTVGRNISLDYLRKYSRIIPTDEPLKQNAEHTEDTVLKNERKRAIHRALETLESDERIVMHLLYIEDLGYEHAERVLRMARPKLYELSRRAKDKLKAELLKEGIQI